MRLKHLFSLRKIPVLFWIIGFAAVACQKTDSLQPVTPPVNPPHDTASNGQPAPVADSAMTLYVGRNYSLYALNAQTGVVKWHTMLGGMVFRSVLYYQGLIYIATSDSNLILHAVDTNGREQWSVNLNPNIGASDIYAANGLIYMATQLSPPVAYDAKTGAVRWTFHPDSSNVATHGGTLYLSRNVLYFVSNNTLFSIDPGTGGMIWRIDYRTIILPAITDGKVIVYDYNGYEEAFDRQTTALLWKLVPAFYDYYTSTASISVDAALGNVYAFESNCYDKNDLVEVRDTATGAMKLTIGMDEGYTGTINCQDSLLYISGHLYLYCYNAVNGAFVWQAGLGVAAPYAWPVLDGVTGVGGTIFYSYDYVYARDGRTSRLIWKTLLEYPDGWCYSVPCVVTKSGKAFRYGNNF
ncbi:MAG TPA: PQQ-binding-like beta-propeller repeat protein [Puia sp.]|nr:PQQ-binding-like beta-propeller repeat protein [Puia sp.]